MEEYNVPSGDVTTTMTAAPNTSNQTEGLADSAAVVVYEPFRVTLIIVLMKLTLIGNVSLISIITCHTKLRRKRVNIFLVNLAVGDLMVCVVVMTTEILFVAFGEWVLGAAACKLIVYAQIVTLASTTFLLTAMSVDRYQVIVKPLQSLRGKPTIWRKVGIAWLLALIFATPQLLIFVQTDEGVQSDGHMKHHCASRGYTAPWQRKLYFSFLTTYILVIPTIIMSYCYINIIKVVWMRCDASGEARQPKLRCTFSKRPTEDSSTTDDISIANTAAPSASVTAANLLGNPPHAERFQRRRSGHVTTRMSNGLTLPRKLVYSSRRKVIKMTLSVIVGFVLCWFPYFVISLVRIYTEYRIKLDWWLSVSEMMAMAHSALNPVLYGIFSTQTVRRDCRQLCCRCRADYASDDVAIMSDEESLRLWKEQAQRALGLRTGTSSVVSAGPRATTALARDAANKDGCHRALWRHLVAGSRRGVCCKDSGGTAESNPTTRTALVSRNLTRAENESSKNRNGFQLKTLFMCHDSSTPGCLGSQRTSQTLRRSSSLTMKTSVVYNRCQVIRRSAASDTPPAGAHSMTLPPRYQQQRVVDISQLQDSSRAGTRDTPPGSNVSDEVRSEVGHAANDLRPENSERRSLESSHARQVDLERMTTEVRQRSLELSHVTIEMSTEVLESSISTKPVQTDTVRTYRITESSHVKTAEAHVD